MHSAIVALQVAATLLCVAGQQQPQEQGAQPRLPLAAILSHRQALSTDGAFNFAFQADNGLQQGETIAPDGSRRGSYSYVDPSGRTISVRYTAGKDGFKIVDGDPSPGVGAGGQPPRAPQPQQVYRPQPPPQAYQLPQPQVYRPQPQAYQQPQPQAYRPQPQPQVYRPQPQVYQPQPQPAAAYQEPSAPAYQPQAAPTPAAFQLPRPSPVPYQVARPALPNPQPVYHAPQVQVTPRPSAPGSLGLFRSTAPATFPQQQQRQQQQEQQIEQAEEEQSQGPHTFGQGYSFEFQG